MPRPLQVSQIFAPAAFSIAYALLAAPCVGADATVNLTAQAATTGSRVRAQLNVGGDLTLEGQNGKAKLPMSVVADLSYREMPLSQEKGTTSATIHVKTARHYDQARATIKIDKGGAQLELPDNRRLWLASATRQGSTLTSPGGPVTREDLDLLDIPAGTHVLDRLLPGRSHSVGEKWKHDQETMKLLLGLDQVSVCEVQSVLTDLEGRFARMRMTGVVHGRTDSAATELEIKAGYLFDTQLGRITRMELAFTEKRESSRFGPAVDVNVKLSLEIDPLPEAEHIAPAELAAAAAASEETRLVVEDEQTGVRLLHDRQWHVTSEGGERMVLRRIDGEQFIAQCHISIRPERLEGRQSTVAEFERDVRFSLGKRFESLVSSGEWTSAAGLLCYRLVVHGNVDGLPMEWRYFLASPPAGPSVAVAVSVQPEFTEQLGDADQAIVETLQLLPVVEANPAAAGASAQKPVDEATK